MQAGPTVGVSIVSQWGLDYWLLVRPFRTTGVKGPCDLKGLRPGRAAWSRRFQRSVTGFWCLCACKCATHPAGSGCEGGEQGPGSRSASHDHTLGPPLSEEVFGHCGLPECHCEGVEGDVGHSHLPWPDHGSPNVPVTRLRLVGGPGRAQRVAPLLT